MKRSYSKTLKRVGGLMAVMVMALCNAGAAPDAKSSGTTLTAGGEALQARYAGVLSDLQAEIGKSVPAVEGQMKEAFKAAREAVKIARAAVNATQQPLDKIEAAQGAVGHAKGKWIGGAEKGITEAEAALKKAATEAERKAAQADLEKWQKNKEDGLKALAERQAVLDAAKADEAKHIQASKDAKAALEAAEANELKTAKAMLADVMPVLSSDRLDAKLVKCAVLAQATPKGLAEFAQQGKEQEALVETLLADAGLMKAMLEAGGANGGKYGQAMKIYADIQKASKKARNGILNRLALGTSLEHAVPVNQRNAVTETNAPAVVDPVKRYLHYEKAYLDGELDPAFTGMSAWECRQIVNSYAPDAILAWGREMLRNYRPDHILVQDYGWRYSGAVRTDVAYRHSQEYTDTDSLQFFQNIIKNGGICGRRAFFGMYIVKCFGLPSVERPQVGHAALARWTPAGWVVNLGAGWGYREAKGLLGMTDADFLLETQMQKYPEDHVKALRAQWVGDALGEEKCNSFKDGSGGLWNVMAHFQKKAIVADAKPAQLAALGTELGEANESAATKAMAVDKATVTDADRQVALAANGMITIPAAVCTGSVQPMKSFLGGLQAFCGGTFSCEVEVPKPGTYQLTARVVTVHDEGPLQLTANQEKAPIVMTIPYTIGKWQATAPVDVTLVSGKNVLTFANPAKGFTLKDITLTPVK